MIIERRKSLREMVYDQLKQLIVDGEIKEGERIVETEYAKKFQISRTPIREAIRMLELEGFVIPNLKGGVLVKEISKKDIEEIYSIRIALESVLLEKVIKKVNLKDIEILEKNISETSKVMSTKNNRDKIFELFSEFNHILQRISESERVIEMITNLNQYIKRFRKISVDDSTRSKLAFEDHTKIVIAIKEKSLEKAVAINKVHLERSRNFITGTIN